jgi:hypothetical protein
VRVWEEKVSLEPFLGVLTPEQIWSIIQHGWIVPAGMVALYFYGKFHFNTPEYPLELALGIEQSSAQLITPAPPIFTTQRSRYNHYSNLYILILELCFIGFIFFYSVLADIGKIANLQVPNISAESLQYRAVLGLFALTGLLSSFPVFKDVDGWLLRELHKDALIPDGAQLLAEKLYKSNFAPKKDIRDTVRSNLSSRDMRRVAAGEASGSLEKRVFDLLCLRTRVGTSMDADKLQAFKITLGRDFKAIERQTLGLQSDLQNYFKDQERIVCSAPENIDSYIDSHSHEEDVIALARRRQDLMAKCDRIYEIMCLVVALSLLATEVTPEDIDAAILEMGFQTKIEPVPILDWDAIGLVTLSSFVLMLAFNALYVLFLSISGLSMMPTFVPTRATIIRFAVIYTIVYAIVMWLAMRLKRRWRRRGPITRQRPENLLIAISSYALTLPFNLVIGYIIRGSFTYAPFLFASNQAIFGYFVGAYIDRSLKISHISFRLALLQGIAQAVGITIASQLSPPVGSTPISSALLVGGFSLLQAAANGFIVGVLFQYFYKQTNIASKSAEIDQEIRVAAPLPDAVPEVDRENRVPAG